MKTCLITGINSFTGPYICEAFKQQNYNIVGTVLSTIDFPNSNGFEVHKMNLLNYDDVNSVIAKTQPNIVIHLAGISFVINNNASRFYDVHVNGTRNLLAALVEHNVPISKIILASSGHVYGPTAIPSEKTPPKAMNDYAVSKIAMEYMSKTWADKLPIIIARPFNYTGVAQKEHFIIPKILSAFVNKISELQLGRTDIKRDFSDVRFIAQCYAALAKEGKIGEVYNLASGKSYSIHYLIEEFSRISGLNIIIKHNKSFVRSNEPHSITADNTKIMGLKKAPEHIPIEKTLRWMFEHANRS